MFSKIKKHILKKHLAAHKPTRNKRVFSLLNAKGVALLCEITDEDSYKTIFRLFTQLQERGCNVKLVGYIDDKIVPFYCLPQLTAEYFCKKNLNWYGLPVMPQLNDFINKEYDILIDFNYRYHSAIEAVLSLSKAKFIIGRETNCKDLYDLYIDTDSKDDKEFLKNVDTYTQKLTGNER